MKLKNNLNTKNKVTVTVSLNSIVEFIIKIVLVIISVDLLFQNIGLKGFIGLFLWTWANNIGIFQNIRKNNERIK